VFFSSVLPGKPCGAQGSLPSGKSHYCVPRAEPPGGKGGEPLGEGMRRGFGDKQPPSPLAVPCRKLPRSAMG